MSENLTSTYQGILKNLSITAFNPMQEAVIQKAQTANNVMVLAPTGSGKTLSFLISILNVLNDKTTGVQALIVVPSRELALQIEIVFKAMKTSYKVSCFYGGHAFKTEQDSLQNPPAVLIATPGRLADHLKRNSLTTDALKIIVLDEFDKSLQMGFHESLRILFKRLSGKQQHILTSATDLEALPDFLPFKKIDTINFLTDKASSNLQLKLVKTKSTDKVETLMRLVAGFQHEVSLVFCNHREAVDRISSVLTSHKIEHGILHGAMEQIDREKNIIKYRGGATQILVATDLASRGLDIPKIKHIIHYQLPTSQEAFVHRNGRTARMHATGEAYLVVADDEFLPSYIDKKSVQEIAVSNTLTKPAPPHYTCLYISAGKKDKVSKGDIAGLLIKKAGLQVDDVGLITILDTASYVSINRSLVQSTLKKLKDERLKKKKVKIEVAS